MVAKSLNSSDFDILIATIIFFVAFFYDVLYWFFNMLLYDLHIYGILLFLTSIEVDLAFKCPKSANLSIFHMLIATIPFWMLYIIISIDPYDIWVSRISINEKILIFEINRLEFFSHIIKCPNWYKLFNIFAP